MSYPLVQSEMLKTDTRDVKAEASQSLSALSVLSVCEGRG